MNGKKGLVVDLDTYVVRVVATANDVTGEDASDSTFEIDDPPAQTYPPPEDLTIWVLIAMGGVIVLIIVIVLMKRKK